MLSHIFVLALLAEQSLAKRRQVHDNYGYGYYNAVPQESSQSTATVTIESIVTVTRASSAPIISATLDPDTIATSDATLTSLTTAVTSEIEVSPIVKTPSTSLTTSTISDPGISPTSETTSTSITTSVSSDIEVSPIVDTTTTSPTTSASSDVEVSPTVDTTTSPVSLATTVATTSASSSSIAQPTFIIRDIAQQYEVALTCLPLDEPDCLEGGLTYFMNHTSGPGDIPDQFTLNEQGNLVCVTPGSIFNGQLGFADGFWFLFLARDSDNAMFFDLCTCSIDPDTSKLNCDCGGRSENCNLVNENGQGICVPWYAFPVGSIPPPRTSVTTTSISSPTSTTTTAPTTSSSIIPSSSSTSASVNPAQPTFVIRDALQNGQEMHLEFDDALGDEGGYPLFRPVTQDHSVFTLNEDGNLFDVTPGLPTNGFEAMSGLIFYMPGNIESIGSDPCVCYIDPNTSRLMTNCDGLTKICLYDSGAILTCNETDANSREMFWYALSVDGIPITTSPSSTTTTGPITAPTTAITTNPITTPTSTTTTSVHLALPTFVIRDANQTLKLAIYSDPSVEIGGVLRFVPAARPGANDTFAIDAETGHLVYVTPGVHTTGDILYAELNRDFRFDTAVDPEVESEFDHYTPCVCSVNSATSQITCECDGTDKFCLNPSFGIVTPCTDPGIPGQDDVEMFWYAYPPDAPSTTTSTSATATGFPAPQPTFAVRDAAQQNELSLISFPELADYAGYPQFGPVANDRRDGEVPLFTLNGDGNLIYVTPGDTDGYYAYGNAGYPFIFEAHDSGDVAQFMYDLCVCAVAPATSRLSCNCGGAITNCLGSCDAWYAFPV